MKAWWCCDCRTTVHLNRSGRCENCLSDAVDIAMRPCVTVEALAATYIDGRDGIAELERMMRQ